VAAGAEAALPPDSSIAPAAVLPPPAGHRPYETGPFRMALGLQSAPEAEWLELDADYPAQLAERRRLIAGRLAEVIAALPGTEPAQQELLALLAAHLPRRYPAWFTREGPVLRNRLLGTAEPLATDDPLGAVGRLVQEDFCLLRPEGEAVRLVGAVLCFPSRWRLAEKMGEPLGAVHRPVPFYGATLERPVDRFIGLLKPGRVAVRLNWSVIDDATLFQPAGHGRAGPDAAITAANAGRTLVLRVERQSFRRLPGSGLVVFGIRIHVTPLEQVLAPPGEAARLHEAVLALPPEMARYKSLLPFRAALLAHLEQAMARG
jgi:hypothetical protein